MRRLPAVCVMLVLAGACSASPPAPEFRPTSTVKDIMDSIIDPNADFLWDSVEVTVSASGTEEKSPKTDDEWKEVRRHAVALIEASNLLLVPGRHIARPGEKAENPKIELPPDEIEALVNQDLASWTRLAHGLQDAGVDSLKSIDARDSKALLYSGDAIDKACENCHLKYWYPNQLKAPQP